MGSSDGGQKMRRGSFYTHPDYINGNYGHIGDVYVVFNYDSYGRLFKHHFILMDDKDWDEYKVYEWTVNGLKMYAASNVDFTKEEWIGRREVSLVYRYALLVSSGREFDKFSFNCNDWTKKMKKLLKY